jgi:hypothetical protein
MRFTLKNIRPIQMILSVFACAFLLFSNVYPAMAIGSTKSSPTDGEVNLTEIERNSEKVLQGGLKSPQELQKQAPGIGGLNEVQGTADKDKMKTPENSRGITFEEEVKSALEQATE